MTNYTTYRDDWTYAEGVVDAGYVYGPDRDTTGLPTAPTDLVKVRPGNPTQNQIAIAATTFGYKTTDRTFTVWSTTLREDPADNSSTAITPHENDRITLAGVTYIIRWIKETIYDTQYLIYCSRSVKTET